MQRDKQQPDPLIRALIRHFKVKAGHVGNVESYLMRPEHRGREEWCINQLRNTSPEYFEQ